MGKWQYSSMPQMLYLQGKSTHYPFDRRLARPQIWYKYCGEQNSLLCLFEINSESLCHTAQ